MIRIAIQSKGRLNEESMALLAEADVKLSVSKRSLLSDSTTFRCRRYTCVMMIYPRPLQTV